MDNEEKAINLFQYIRELCALRYKVITNIKNEEWYQFFNEIPYYKEYMKCPFLENNNSLNNENSIILQITKFRFEDCPEIPDILKDWIDIDWKNYDAKLKRKNQIVKTIDNVKTIISFEKYYSENKEEFKNSLIKWNQKREEWIQRQKKIEKTNAFFLKLREKYDELKQNSENIELMIGQGILEYQEKKESIFYPILVKKVILSFDSNKNMLTISDSDTNTEMTTTFLKEVDILNKEIIKTKNEELTENMYHPLDKKNTPQFLYSFTNEISPSSSYQQDLTLPINKNDKIIVYNNPVLFIRKRTGGILRSLDMTIDQIEETKNVTEPILNLIGKIERKETDNVEKQEFNAMLSDTRGEDPDILLSKEANREQLEIARNIEKYSAVLVQGPPGTGKTHTIANLMGHFLAQGKNILVTSHTKKALSVVKEKVVPELQSLCVSMLEDNNIDMEHSVSNIIEYLDTHNSEEVLKCVNQFEQQRKETLKNLSEVRDKLYAIQHKEYETIIFAGEGYNVAEAAEFVNKNSDELSYIPGPITLYKPLPISIEEMQFLYQTNGTITEQQEIELQYHLPNPETILDPEQFKNNINEKKDIKNKLIELQNSIGEYIDIDIINGNATIQGQPLYSKLNIEKIEQLKAISNITKLNLKWQLNAILSGKQNDGYKVVWQNLVNNIKETYEFSNIVAPIIIGKNIEIPSEAVIEKNIVILEQLKEKYFSKGKKINIFTFIGKNDWKELYQNIKIDQHQISTTQECEIVISFIKLKLNRIHMQQMWTELIEKQQGMTFNLLGETPEQQAIIIVPQIEECLNWYATIYKTIKDLILECGLNNICIPHENSISSIEEIKQMVQFVYERLPQYITLAEILGIKLSNVKIGIENTTLILKLNTVLKSSVCKNMVSAIEQENIEEYQKQYTILSKLYEKYTDYNKRNIIIEKIACYAPKWAEAIKNRSGVHGNTQIPKGIEDAWKWKQFSCIIDSITEQPFEKLQKKEAYLRKELQKVTAKLAENKAWYHLLLRIEHDATQKQALEGWKQTVRKIGKGTGKRAAQLRKKAQELMTQCQKSVPAWIMSISQALEGLDPKNSKFDIVIVDEASQSDISALAIFYLAKKIIIVGDDEQVSPSGIGLGTEKGISLSQMYLSDIPNSHLYDMTTSLYDIAKTTFKTLMLKEHFKCVPSIIGYSNRWSYDYKIKPLRDDSNVTVKPATIEYRVNGKRDNRKRNEIEAKNIVALMLACMEQEEYKNMTFGAISLLGSEQAKLIRNIAIDKINPKDYEDRKILCGDASFFQGDERDVIFISLVDSNEGEGPLRLTGEGSGKSIKQRYNVAVSRAKDQIWVVHSLDINNDLKQNDIRRNLITYMKNPNSFEEEHRKIEKNADSPFEVSVASALVKNGYHIVQQWAVGAYRIDMVAIYQNQKIAIECDGERFHSGEEKLREDMERQAILERLGWRFIRIRGSEYYRDPAKTIKRVISELTEFGIEPESNQCDEKQNITNLQKRVIIRASRIMEEWK